MSSPTLLTFPSFRFAYAKSVAFLNAVQKNAIARELIIRLKAYDARELRASNLLSKIFQG